MTRRTALKDWQRFLLAESHILQDRPRSLFQQAANQPKDSTQAIAAYEWLSLRHRVHPWFRHLDKQAETSACLMTLVHRGHGEDAIISPDGKRIASIMGTPDNSWLNIWNGLTGLGLAEIELGECGHVRLEFSGDATHLASLGSGRLVLVDALTGKVVLRESGVDSFTFSPSGSRLVLGDYEGRVRLLDVTSGASLSQLTKHARAVSCCAFSPAGEYVVSGSFLEIRITRLGPPSEVQVRLAHADFVKALSISQDGKRFLSSSGPEVILWETLTGKMLNAVSLSTSSRPHLAFPACGPRIVYKDDRQKALILLDGETGARTAGLADGCDDFALSPDGSKIVSVSTRDSGEAEISLWDGFEQRSFLRIPRRASRLVFSPDGKTLAVVVGGEATQRSTIGLYEIDTGARLQEIEEDALRSVGFSRDCRRLITSSYGRTVRIWDAGLRRSGTSRPSLHGFHVRACAYSPDGKTVVTGSSDGTLLLWDRSAPGRVLASAESDSVMGCAFSPDGRRLVTLSPGARCIVWNAASLKAEAEFRSGMDPNSPGERSKILFSPDGKRLWTGGTFRPVELWDFERLTRLTSLGEGRDFALSPDGRYAAFAPQSRHAPLRLHDGTTGSPLATLHDGGGTSIGNLARGIWSCTFSPDGMKLLTASPLMGLHFWDVESREHLRGFRESGSVRDPCFFSPDGAKVGAVRFTSPWPGSRGAAGWDLRLWSAADGSFLTSIRGRHYSRTIFFFSPDGSSLAAAGDSGRFSAWDAESGSDLGEFRLLDGIGAAVPSPDGRQVVLGCESGRVLMLALEGQHIGPPVITAWARPASRINLIARATIGVRCLHCGAWSRMPSAAAGTVANCPRCGGCLRINPFTVNADWRPAAAACRAES